MYCYKCGQEIPDDAAFCPHCGANVKRENKDINVHPKTDYRALREIAKVLMILSDIALGFLIIPLFWCIPMTVHYFRAVREKRRVSEAFKVCTILFVSIVAGILMLVDDEFDYEYKKDESEIYD